MSENHQADAPPGVAALVGGILEDAQKLVRQEVALAQREVALTWDKAKMGVALLAGALTVCSVAGVLLGFMVVRLLYQYLLPNHEWACFAIAGCLVALIGGALIYCGLKQISQVHLSLPQTAETLREDVQAVSDAMSGGRPSPHALLKR
jgi:Putative Actinobacterial Holin-X, holin superfamily III